MDFERDLERLLAHSDQIDTAVFDRVGKIVNDVRESGDLALLDHTNRFDGRNATSEDLEIPTQEMAMALQRISPTLRESLMESASRITHYHKNQKIESWSYEDKDGTLLGQQVSAMDRVGVYIPGGTAVYPSSVLMNVIPAVVAGVPEIVMVVPAPAGKLNDAVLAAASIVGVTRAFSIGGAQAIAALSYGTETVPKVDKVVGPGNIYVTTAKRMVFGTVGIDMIAGPSEILIVCDGQADPDWLAMDMFAQAEHDEDATTILVSTDPGLLDAVATSMERLLPELPRREIIKAALESNGALVAVDNLDQAVQLINRIAPEHLELALSDPMPLLQKIRHAGAIFIGVYSTAVFGDYCAGPNHVLPTSRTARFSSPLGVYDFQKRSSLLKCTKDSAAKLASVSTILANSEGFTAHARSAEYREIK